MFKNVVLMLVLLIGGIAIGEDGIRYQYQQDRLGQPMPTDFTPSKLGGSPFDWREYGITATHVDRSSGWRWKNVGGDWIDRNLTPQGSAPWLSFPANAIAGLDKPYRYSVDVTDVVNQVRRSGKWNALILKAAGVSRSIAGVRHAAAPVINVVYTDGTAGTLAAIYSTRLTTSTTYVGSMSPTHTLPAVLEFEKPSKDVQAATLLVTVTSHPSGKSTITGNLLDPPVNNRPVEYGLAATAGLLDEGITNNPAVIGAQRYVDGTTRDQFVSSSRLNVYAERDYDPAIWGRGERDLTKIPHRDLGKWFSIGDNFQLVNSKADGFVPLAPGLGAMRLVMDVDPTLKDGSIINYSGTRASNGKIFLPDSEFGLLQDLYVRYYIRFNQPLENTFAKRLEVRRSPTGPPVWTDMGGKFGITPAHDTTLGGVSGTAGGGYGWQMRLLWSDRNDLLGPPTAGAITMGVHTYDFGLNNPVGHRYGDGKKPHMLGDEGGLGGVMWPGRWYCIEQRVKLNTVMPEAPGYIADGIVEVWVDGRLSLRMTDMVMRSLPLAKKEYRAGYIRPARELGHRDLWFNVFHGGKTENTVFRSYDMTGLVYAKAYIGPMRLPAN